MGLSNIHKIYLFGFLRNLQFFGAVSVPFFLDWVKIDYTKMFILEAWFMLCVFLLEIPTGTIADRFGRKFSVAAGSVFFFLAMMVFGLFRSYPVLFFAEFLAALGVALVSGADNALIYDTLMQMKKQKDARHFFSRYASFSSAGLIIALPAGSLLVGSGLFGYPFVLPLTMMLGSVSAFLAFIVMLSVAEPKRHKPLQNLVKEGILGLKYLAGHSKLRAFAFNSVLISATTSFIFWLYQPLSGMAGINIAYYGFISAGFNLFSILLLLNVKRLERHFEIKNLIFFTALLPGLLLVGLAFFRISALVIAGIFLIVGFRQLRAPILADFMNRQISSRNRATVLSSVSMFERLAIAIMYPVVGILADLSMVYVLVFLGTLTLLFAVITRVEASYLNPA